MKYVKKKNDTPVVRDTIERNLKLLPTTSGSNLLDKILFINSIAFLEVFCGNMFIPERGYLLAGN